MNLDIYCAVVSMAWSSWIEAGGWDAQVVTTYLKLGWFSRPLIMYLMVVRSLEVAGIDAANISDLMVRCA